METVYHRCCGMDVHKKSVTVCVRSQEPGSEAVQQQMERYGTYLGELERLRDWLVEQRVESVVMESTGIYWVPVWNVLEAGPWELKLVNAQHVKQVPGRKTDLKDSQWLAELEQVGLLRGSFVAGAEMRQLRGLTRLRANLEQEHSRMVQRVQKVLERGNVKLASVVSDVMGKSGRRMLAALAEGCQDAEAMAAMGLGRLRSRKAELRLALQGRFQAEHAYELKLLLGMLQELEARVSKIEGELRRRLETGAEGSWEDAACQAVQLLDTIPGIDWVLAVTIVAEIGVDMRQYGSARHLSSWAGMCPGNHESAGKRLSGKMRKGNRWLRRALCEAAWAGSRTKNSSLRAQYQHLARKGKKRAIMAVGHTILTIAYHLIERQSPYREAGAHHFLARDREAQQRYHLKALHQLGFQVTLSATTPTPAT